MSTLASGTSTVSITQGLPSARGGGPGGGGSGSITSCSTSGGVLYENGTANTATCSSNLVWTDATSLFTNITVSPSTSAGIIVVSGGPTNTIGYAGVVGDTELSPTVADTGTYIGVAGQANSVGMGGGSVVKNIGVQALGQSAANVSSNISVGTILGVYAGVEAGATGVVSTEGSALFAASPAYVTGSTPPPLTTGLHIQDQNPTGTTTSDGLLIDTQSGGQKAIWAKGPSFFNSITCGVLNTTSCVFTGYGSMSGTANCTWPAVAGTTTNSIACSNTWQAPAFNATSLTTSLSDQCREYLVSTGRRHHQHRCWGKRTGRAKQHISCQYGGWKFGPDGEHIGQLQYSHWLQRACHRNKLRKQYSHWPCCAHECDGK